MSDTLFSLVAEVVKESSTQVVLQYPGVGKLYLDLVDNQVIGYSLRVNRDRVVYEIDNVLPLPMPVDAVRIDYTVELLYRDCIQYYYNTVRRVMNNKDLHYAQYNR